MHRRLDSLAATGYAVLRDHPGPLSQPAEWEALTYLGARGARQANFAPLATANGELDCRDFWEHGRADKDGQWTANRAVAPGLAGYVAAVGARFGRVRVVKGEPGPLDQALRQLHRDDCNRLNPDGSGWVVQSWLELADTPDQTVFILRTDPEDPATETRVRLHPGLQLVIDSARLWHTVWHPGPGPRYALVASWESGHRLDAWIRREAARVPAQQDRSARPVRADQP